MLGCGYLQIQYVCGIGRAPSSGRHRAGKGQMSNVDDFLSYGGREIGIRYDLGELDAHRARSRERDQIADPNVSRVHAEIIRRAWLHDPRPRLDQRRDRQRPARAAEGCCCATTRSRVGNTVFLFNSDLQMRNARFSDNTVYLFRPDEATIQVARGESTLSRSSGGDRAGRSTSSSASRRCFSGPGSSLAEISERLVTQPDPDPHGRHRDPACCVTGQRRDLRPVIALPANVPLRINRGLLATCAEEMEHVRCLGVMPRICHAHERRTAGPRPADEPSPAGDCPPSAPPSSRKSRDRRTRRAEKHE